MPETELIEKPDDVKAVLKQRAEDAVGVIKMAKELARSIHDQESLQSAVDFCLVIRKKRKDWAEWNKPAKQKLDALKKEILGRERMIDEPLERAEVEILVPAISTFRTEQERLKKIEDERRLAEAKKAEEEDRIQRAANLESAGLKEEAEHVLNAPASLAPQTVPEEKIAGGNFREDWCFEISNEALIPREYLSVDEIKIRGVVRALKGETKIPGVRVFSKPVLVQGRRS